MRTSYWSDDLYHHGIKGQRWYVRRFQNQDGSLTEEGRKRYSKSERKIQKDEKALLRTMSEIGYKQFDKLMTAEQVRRVKKGSCHDQVMLEYDVLSKLGLKPKIKFFIEANKDNQGGATHSLVYYEKNGKINWIENAWSSQKGIHEYSSVKDMLADVHEKWEKNDAYPMLYSGDIDHSKLKKGMTLGEILSVVDYDD